MGAEGGDGEVVRGDGGDVEVVEEDDLAGVGEEGGGVGGEEVLIFAETEDERAAAARADDDVREVPVDDSEGERAFDGGEGEPEAVC